LSLVPAALLSLSIIASACGEGSPSPTATANSDISQGLSAKAAGRLPQAIDDFNAAAAANPTDPIPYYDLGVMYQLVENNPAQAASEYDKALLADASYKPALYNLAILETPSNPAAAISLYNQLLKMNPNDANVLFNLGLLLHSHGQTLQGQADVTKADFLDPALKSRVPANSGITP
jgi:tetratricopeptide (TPR) repeat protein